jgi:Spy/CpxP family protein refolding chaperone
MKSHVLAACTAVLALSSLCDQTTAFARQGPAAERKGGMPMMGWGHGMMGGDGMDMMGPAYGTLDLTKDQRNRIYAIHRSLRDKQFALMDRMHDTMQSVTFYRNR